MTWARSSSTTKGRSTFPSASKEKSKSFGSRRTSLDLRSRLTDESHSASMQIVTDAERARYEVLLEQIRDRIMSARLNALAKGHDSLNARMDRISTRLDVLSSNMHAFKREFGQRLDRLEAHLENGHAPKRRPKKK